MIILACAVVAAFTAVAYESLALAVVAYLLVVATPALEVWRVARRERAEASLSGKLARAEVLGTWPRRDA